MSFASKNCKFYTKNDFNDKKSILSPKSVIYDAKSDFRCKKVIFNDKNWKMRRNEMKYTFFDEISTIFIANFDQFLFKINSFLS